MGEDAQFPEADGGGGRSARGPSTNVPGETEPGGALPPYDGRQTEGDPDEMTRKARTGDSADGEMSSPDPESTPGGRTASPADEQPAAEMPETAGDDPGVDVGHVPGAPTGEDGGT